MARSGSQFEFFDLVDLLLLRLAKTRRSKLTTSLEPDQKQFYAEFFTANDQDVLLSSRDPRRHFRQEEVNRALERRLTAGALVFDIGCGLGDNLAGIPERWRLGGIEYSLETARIAQARLSGRALIALGSGTALPLASASVDAVTCLEVLEHLEDDQAALREINRILARNGLLIAAVPYRFWFKQYLPLMGHYRHYTRSDFQVLLEKAGFEVLEYLPNCPHWSRLINYCYVACRILAIGYRLLGQNISPLDVKLPGTRRPLIVRLTNALLPQFESERRMDYRRLESSTFVLAQKK
jgi:ubiquinone/menaquinone biosynthesis C-methylase UbiE